MSPVPLSPISKMAHPIRTSSHDSTADSIRKRVCKACDRCRLKKSKCDGLSPCTRCKADNAICVFGERKKSHDKVYPKGYVEMLEQQQGQLVAGLQKMYSELRAANAWPGTTLEESNGQPLTHDILNGLGLLETKHDGTGEVETFEEDYHKLQSKLLADGAGYMQRRGSISSESDHSQHGQRSAQNTTPNVSQHPIFQDGFNFSSPSSPVPQSPAPRVKRQSYREAQPSPLQQASPLSNDPQLFQAEWAIPDMSTSTPEQILRSKYAMQSSFSQQQQQQSMNDMDMYNTNLFSASAMSGYDSTNFSSMSMMASYQPPSNTYGGTMDELQEFAANNSFDRLSAFDPMAEVEFNNFVQVMT